MQEEVAVGVVVPIVVIVLSLVIPIPRRRYQTQRQADVDNNTALPKDAQPYLQQKSEMGAEERGTYEIQAQEVRYEMQGEDTIHEIGLAGDLPGLSRCQELQGPDPSKKLEVPNQVS